MGTALVNGYATWSVGSGLVSSARRCLASATIYLQCGTYLPPHLLPRCWRPYQTPDPHPHRQRLVAAGVDWQVRRISRYSRTEENLIFEVGSCLVFSSDFVLELTAPVNCYWKTITGTGEAYLVTTTASP